MEYRQDGTFRKPSVFNPGIAEYAERMSTACAPELRDLSLATKQLVPEWADILTSAVQVNFLQFLIKSCGVRRVLEIGTFTGHGTLAMAAALPADGEVVTVDNYATDPRARPIAEQAFKDSDLADRITQVFEDGDTGIETATGRFDLIFLDADKPSYIRYYENILRRNLLSQNGMLVIDNTLWGGDVLTPRVLPPASEADNGDEWVERMFAEWTHSVIAFNEHVAADPRVQAVLLTVQDGMTLIRRAR